MHIVCVCVCACVCVCVCVCVCEVKSSLWLQQSDLVEEEAVRFSDGVRLTGRGRKVILILQNGLFLCSGHLQRTQMRERERGFIKGEKTRE